LILLSLHKIVSPLQDNFEFQALNPVLGFGNHKKSRVTGSFSMTEPTPVNPSPTAVPWTPDMMNSHGPSAEQQPGHAHQQLQHYQTQHQPPAQMQSQPQYAHPQPQSAAQAYAPQPQHMAAPQMAQQVTPQPQFQGGQFAPQAQMAHSPAHQQHPNQAHPAPSHFGQPQFSQAPLNQPQVAPHAGRPPLAPLMRAPAAAPSQNMAEETVPESKSLFAKLLKRSPKPIKAQSDMPAPNAGSLFNKNFALGALTGLVIGAFILPMALDMLGGDTPVQTQVQAGPPPIIETTPTIAEGDTFIDEAIAANAP